MRLKQSIALHLLMVLRLAFGWASQNERGYKHSTWQPSVGTSWQIVLSAEITAPYPKVSVFDLDLFDTPKATIRSTQKHGTRVICYFSAGSYEDWRSDAKNFTVSDLGRPLDGWPGENWLDTSSLNVRKIMLTRLEMAAIKGCDGIDPDNTDGYDNDSGLNLTKETAVDYMTFLADVAQQRGLSIGLKNSNAIIPHVIHLMQWAVNEQCVAYDECDAYRPFINSEKPVFNIEYPNGAPEITSKLELKICGDPQRANFSTLLKEMSLDQWYYAC